MSTLAQAVPHQRFRRIKKHRQPTAGLRRQRAGRPHPMLADADAHWDGDDDFGEELAGDLLGDPSGAEGVVGKGQVFQMLLNAAGGDDGGLQFAPLQPLPKFPTRQSLQQNFLRHLPSPPSALRRGR
jgi:hypothetical protein